MSIFNIYHSSESTDFFCNLAIYYNLKDTSNLQCIFNCGKCIDNKPHVCKNCGKINHHRTSLCPRLSIPCIFNCNKCISGQPHICENCGRKNSHLKKNCPLLRVKCLFNCANCVHQQPHFCRNCFKSNVHCRNNCNLIFCYFCNMFGNHKTYECYKIQQIQTYPIIKLNNNLELDKLNIELIDSVEFEKLINY